MYLTCICLIVFCIHIYSVIFFSLGFARHKCCLLLAFTLVCFSFKRKWQALDFVTLFFLFLFLISVTFLTPSISVYCTKAVYRLYVPLCLSTYVIKHHGRWGTAIEMVHYLISAVSAFIGISCLGDQRYLASW